MSNTTALRVGACLAGAMVGVFLLVAVPGCQWGDGVALLPTDRLAAVEATLNDSVLRARIETALLLSPVIGSTRMAVDVVKGAVLLSGSAEDPTQVELALFVVANVPGVIRVESILVTRAQDQESGAGQRKAPMSPGPGRASRAAQHPVPSRAPARPRPVPAALRLSPWEGAKRLRGALRLP